MACMVVRAMGQVNGRGDFRPTQLRDPTTDFHETWNV